MNDLFQVSHKDKTLSLGQKIKSGTIWAFIGQVGLQFLSLITVVVLARLLSPQDFGVVAIALAAWGIIHLFGNLGIGAKLIQEQDDFEKYASAAFWLNILIALCLSLFTIIIAPFVASFYKNDLVKPILMFLGLGFFLNSFGSTHSVLLVRELDFKKRTLVGITIGLITKTATILMAFMGYGVWSLVIPQILFSPIQVFALWKICPWRPSFEFNLLYWKRIFNFGKYMFGDELLRYINLNGDYLVIGRWLGSFELGLYTFAYRLASFPVENIAWVVSRVTFPAFSKLQNDLDKLRELFLKMIRLLSLISFPLLMGLLAMANELVPLVFGEKWNRSIIPLQIIIGFALLTSLNSLAGQIVIALGRPKIPFKFNLAQVPLVLVAILICVKYGIIGVAIAMSLVVGFFGVLFFRSAIGLIDLNVGTVLKVLFPALASSLLMLFLVLALKYVLIGLACESFQILLLCIPFGAVVYVFALITFFRSSFQMLWAISMDILGNRITGIGKTYVQDS